MRKSMIGMSTGSLLCGLYLLTLASVAMAADPVLPSKQLPAPQPDTNNGTSSAEKTPKTGAAEGAASAASSKKNEAPVTLGAQPSAAAKDCYQYAKESRNEYVIVLDAAADPPRFFSPASYTYAGQTVRVCIANPDYSKKYEIFANYADLAPPQSFDISDIRGKNGEKAGADDALQGNNELRDYANYINNCKNDSITEPLVAPDGSGKTLLSAEQALSRLAYEPGYPVSAAQAATIELSIATLLDNLIRIKHECREVKLKIAAIETALVSTSKPLSEQAKKYLNDVVVVGKRFIVDSERWTGVFQFAISHIQSARQNVFNVSSRANSEVEVVVRTSPLVYAETGSADSKSINLSYGKATEVARYTFQIRSLSYVRFGVSVGYSSTHSQTVGTTRNDLGVEVLRRTDELGIVPMVVMTHYWCGADEREIQPWHRGRGCWKWNLLPTIAVGLPITPTNTLQHIFMGLVWQPIPAIGIIGGAHLGRVNRLRPEFFDGMALPASSSNFRPEVDAVETVTRLGWYVGAVITDATFIKLIRDALGGGSKK